MNTTIDIAQLFIQPEAAAAFVRRAEEIRDSYDGLSAAHYRAWESVVIAARKAVRVLEDRREPVRQAAADVFGSVTTFSRGERRVRLGWSKTVNDGYERAMTLGVPIGIRMVDIDEHASGHSAGDKALVLINARLIAVDGNLGFDITGVIRRELGLDEVTDS